jgi:hypothetical protein
VLGGTLRLDEPAALAASRVTVFTGGTLGLAPRGAATVGGLVVNAGGLTDVGSGAITVVSGLAPPDLVAAIVSGLGDGSWNGAAGITSSAAVGAQAAGQSGLGVGWLDNGDGSVTFAYAAAGDSNLDWFVDILDAANLLAAGRFDAGFGSSWNDGDFGYDGLVDILDAASFLSTGLFDAGGYNEPSPAAVAAVPEPAFAAWITLAATAVAGRSALRRRRS